MGLRVVNFFLAVVLCLLPFFSQARESCRSLFESTRSASVAGQIADNVYEVLTSTSKWEGAEYSSFFQNKDQFPEDLRITDVDVLDKAKFIYSRFNDANAFRDFIFRAQLEAEQTSVSWPSRKKFMDVLMRWLRAKGFIVKLEKKTFSPQEFSKLIGQGIVLDDLGLRDDFYGHGRDSHLMQIAYIADQVDAHYGAGAMLEFYKLMGTSSYEPVWNRLFDSPGSEHLGHPMIYLVAFKFILGNE